VILGWDIGGVNTKVACLGDNGVLVVQSRAFELQRDPEALVDMLCEMAAEVGVASADAFICAVTMTAELSQMFRTKRDGVRFVLDAVETAFPRADVHVYTVGGGFLAPAAAREQPLVVAAANWSATARLIAQRYPTAVLVDIGTTTTDIIPVVDGEMVAIGATDPDRLSSGELVYSGALRTPVEAIVRAVPYRDGMAGVSAESFALAGDVHLWRGRLAPEDYTVPTPDGRPATREYAGERLARVVCADREMLDDESITRIAEAIASEQVRAVAKAIRQVVSRHPQIRAAVVTALGSFIAAEAARAAGLEVRALADDIGEDAARYAPAAAVALLCATDRGADVVTSARASLTPGPPSRMRDGVAWLAPRTTVIVKVGGGLLTHVEHLDRVLVAIADVARTHRVLIVPGGGPFADVVRDVDARLGLGQDAAHWMAVLAMDQYAQLLASRLSSGVVVSSRAEIEAAHVRSQLPVLAPSAWLSAADPLPHSWDVTSDSIAAWVAGELQAARLVLVKSPGARGAGLVDAHFHRALPPTVAYDCLAADDAIQLLNQMAGIVNPAFETT
jgi:probable H4MPT-linked C1 transfer pathway protein